MCMIAWVDGHSRRGEQIHRIGDGKRWHSKNGFQNGWQRTVAFSKKRGGQFHGRNREIDAIEQQPLIVQSSANSGRQIRAISRKITLFLKDRYIFIAYELAIKCAVKYGEMRIKFVCSKVVATCKQIFFVEYICQSI